MIVSNRNYMFGTGQVGVIKNEKFCCVISTAPEGFFKRYSTVIQTFQGEWGQQTDRKVVAKALLHPTMGKAQRIGFHRAVLADLDILGDKGLSLPEATEDVFATAKDRNLVVDFVNQAHSTADELEPDSTQAIREIIEAQGRQIEAEHQRLLAIIRGTAERIGEPPSVR